MKAEDCFQMSQRGFWPLSFPFPHAGSSVEVKDLEQAAVGAGTEPPKREGQGELQARAASAVKEMELHMLDRGGRAK